MKDKIYIHTGRLGFMVATETNITGNDVEYIRKDAWTDKIHELIKTLERQNPDPLGNIAQCLAASEIEALKIVLDTMKELN